ncbi:MAG TPA: GAF domain-containing protein [Nitrospiraceae bacterium]|nr:GAF domain-containing protein [Nitrospiraceae bacterium]
MRSIPMMVRGKTVGVINNYTSLPHRFTGEDVTLLQAIADLAAMPSSIRP